MKIVSTGIEDNDGNFLEIFVADDGLIITIGENEDSFIIQSEKELNTFVETLKESFEEFKFYNKEV